MDKFERKENIMIPSKYKIVRTIVLTAITLGVTASLSGQFPIKIPKIKVDKPKPTQSDSSGSTEQQRPSGSSPAASKQNSSSNSKEERVKLDPPLASKVPV